MNKFPVYPILHTELTPDDIPFGYSCYVTVFDDLRGYEPRVVGVERDDDYRQVIIVALSPGQYVRCTMVTVGWDLDRACEAVINGFVHAQSIENPAGNAPQPGSARAPNAGPHNREAHQ